MKKILIIISISLFLKCENEQVYIPCQDVPTVYQVYPNGFINKDLFDYWANYDAYIRVYETINNENVRVFEGFWYDYNFIQGDYRWYMWYGQAEIAEENEETISGCYVTKGLLNIQ